MCRAWVEVLDRRDGSYVVRYKFHHTSCHNVVISVTEGGQHLGPSPVHVAGTVHPDTCRCPEKDLGRWMEEVGCPAETGRMSADLARWRDGVDINKGLEMAKKEFNNPGAHAWCHYAVINNTVHR